MKKFIFFLVLVLCVCSFSFLAFAYDDGNAVTPYYTWTKDPDLWSIGVSSSENFSLTPGSALLKPGTMTNHSDWLGYNRGDSSSFKALKYSKDWTISGTYPTLVWTINAINRQSIPLIPYQTTQSAFITIWIWSPSGELTTGISEVYSSLMVDWYNRNDVPVHTQSYPVSASYIGTHPEDSSFHGYTLEWTFTQTGQWQDEELYGRFSSLRFNVRYGLPTPFIYFPSSVIAVSRMVVSNGTWDPQYIPKNPGNLDADQMEEEFRDWMYSILDNAYENNPGQPGSIFNDLTINKYARASNGLKGLVETLFSKVPIVLDLFILSAAVGLFCFLLSIGRKGRS